MFGQRNIKDNLVMKNKKEPPQGEAAFIADAASLPTQEGAPGQETLPLNFQDYIVDFTKPAPRPDFLLEIDGVGIMPAGGITAVTGRAKQGKTQFLAAIVACLLSGRDFGRMKRRQAPGKILWVDTEQSAYNICNTIGRVYNLAGIPQGEASSLHGLTVLQVRQLEPDQRRDVIAAAITSIAHDVLIIDGIRDLMHDFNDITQSGQMLTWLAGAINSRPGMRIAVVLHTNPGGDKMRGHLGTEIENKLNDKFTCSKSNGVFSVSHECRDREILTPFVFCIDENGQLSTSTVEQSAGVVAPDEALQRAVPDEGAPFLDIVKAYAKLTGMTQAKARDALKARLNSNPPTLIKHDDLFFRVKHTPPGRESELPFEKPKEDCPY